MKKQVLLEHDTDSGQIFDGAGMYVATWSGDLENVGPAPSEDEGVPIDKLLALKAAGFESDEIINMHKRGLL